MVKQTFPDPWESQPSRNRRHHPSGLASTKATPPSKMTATPSVRRPQAKSFRLRTSSPEKLATGSSGFNWSLGKSLPKLQTRSRKKGSKRWSQGQRLQATASKPPQKRLKKRRVSPWVYIMRLIILGIGLGAIVGTILSAIDRDGYLYTNKSAKSAVPVTIPASPSPSPIVTPPSLLLGQEITTLQTQLETLAAKQPELKPQAFFVDLDTQAYVDLEGATAISAASTIKVPVLVAFFQDLDAGKVRLDETLTMTEAVKAGGSGDMQYQALGTEYTALETVTKMIVISDNTATNMIIERLGGAEALNTRFRAWGLANTQISNPLPDLEGTNTTSPQDLARLMATVSNGEILSARSRDWVLDIMKRTKTRTLLPQGLGEGALIAHKTGDIGSMVGDVGVIDMPNGKRYVGVAMVQRPHNNPKAQELIRQMSRQVYQHFEQFPTTESFTSSPEASTEEGDGE